MKYEDVALWEIHEAFAAQVLCNIKGLEAPDYVREKSGVAHTFGRFPAERVNPNGGSVALGHPFAATGARILSQAVARARRHGEGKSGGRERLRGRRSGHRRSPGAVMAESGSTDD